MGEAQAETLVGHLGQGPVDDGDGGGAVESAEGAERGILDVFDENLLRKDQRELARQFGQQVGVEVYARSVRVARDPEERGDPADADDVRLYDLRGARAHDVVEAVAGVDVLAE